MHGIRVPQKVVPRNAVRQPIDLFHSRQVSPDLQRKHSNPECTLGANLNRCGPLSQNVRQKEYVVRGLSFLFRISARDAAVLVRASAHLPHGLNHYEAQSFGRERGCETNRRCLGSAWRIERLHCRAVVTSEVVGSKHKFPIRSALATVEPL